MVANGKSITRTYIGSELHEVCELPNLIGVQLDSYERFLQLDRCLKGMAPDPSYGLEEVFQSTFPIDSPNGEMRLAYKGYTIDYDNIKFSEMECKKKGRSYSVPIKVTISLEFSNGEMREKEIFFGDIPLMTDRGTFIINGAERVVVSQIHRSPGVIFSNEKDVYSSRIIPYRGSWLEFEIDDKKHLIYTKIDRKKRILGTLFLRAIGLDTREKILEHFYTSEMVDLVDDADFKSSLENRYLYKDVYATVEGASKKVLRAGDMLHAHEIDELLELKVTTVELVNLRGEGTLHSDIILNCFEIEDAKYTREGYDEPTKEDVLSPIFSVLMPGEMIAIERAERDLPDMFFSSRRYDLGSVGRYKFNKKFGTGSEEEEKMASTDLTVLTPQDIVNTMGFLIKVFIREENVDDIDHLGNRRVRSVGELLQNALKSAFARMERIAKERMNLESGSVKPQDLISIKPIIAAIKEFFGSSQLSQFMDQVNPLAELTHKRRLNALGPGGLSRDRAGFEVRDVHYTHYGRICPIETPEGPNIGLIVSLANYTRINQHGFLESPYRKVVNGVVSKQYRYLDANDEEKFFIAQANAKVDDDGNFLDKEIPVRRSGDYSTKPANEIKYIDVSPKQVLSVAASLIPFLEHDDANRALMGSNMQRQAVPLVFPETPRVGTGMEGKAAYDSGVLVKAKRAGTIAYVSAEKVVISVDDAEIEGEMDVYPIQKFQRTNQDTCFNQKPIVTFGQHVEAGAVLADGPATQEGELALGRNILVGFVPWHGYNYEDAVLISERVIKDDIFTSVHIKEFTTDIRETKLGPEKLTRDIPNTSEKMLEQLDEDGIVRIGTMVRPGSILVGKVTPKSESDTTPEFKLLNSIFGEKAKEVRDTSLKVPHGTEGTVIDIQRLKRSNNDELPPGVEETVKVLIATKRKLRQGDKMAGRHGNKGVVSRILAEEDMPFMEDGTPLDVCLNPLGVPSRMNIGQLMETQLGWAAVKLGEWYSTPVFQSATMNQIEEKMRSAGLPENSKVRLYDGQTGVPFINPVFCGYIYYLKLHHLVDDKMHARSTGPYSLVTQQPLGGKAQFGGQRLGEMEVWALEAYGAANTLQELLTIKSDDMNGRVKIYESIVKGEPASTAGMPEAFNVLVQEIRGLALDMSVYDSKGQQVPLTERDEELIAKQSKGSLN
ncbi:MAG: DNA-directed polymerase subunit beta [Sphaerochaeta sp.]|uniref:DNA-directed RNA polymerase subunit beta n=1 Tax=Sphaerochaeta halotolerans TaxID=2293840 RepID=A0A372MIW5_9SPIR|nr:DNA-directed RNA polymerase subunit beta [Sphaerochaeta halotolerans]MBG0765989.1 DNA-directed RNA polymerase subunit beta [Spirochaetaceae bacterium]MDK2858947.1 DNA-directed polymerase subunit beta [Sphaerochaeta sp.]MDN5333050.1 DNA-directed polymerase subunit beta [Sphaerochaeta sp.]RFU95715.1 DNA-directed RNA polymerase subunit beta [Sphaerochaeta halotolerans]